MTRFFSLAAIAGLALSSMTTQALAIAGGPFDNGLPSAQLENGGVYQATLSLRNGNGYCYFRPDAQISPEILGQPQAGVNAKGTLSNRSVIYYKGVTYVGSAFGMSDPEGNYLQCSVNAGSELVNQQTQTGQGQNNNTFNFNQNTASVTNQIVASARNFTVNGNWEAKFTQTAPTRRFRGSGELVFLAPTAADAVANLALQSYANFISAINAFFAAGPADTIGGESPDFILGQEAISNALNAIDPFLSRAGVDNAFKNGTRENIQVRGVFKYLR
jgi:hypothetical protein